MASFFKHYDISNESDLSIWVYQFGDGGELSAFAIAIFLLLNKTYHTKTRSSVNKALTISQMVVPLLECI